MWSAVRRRVATLLAAAMLPGVFIVAPTVAGAAGAPPVLVADVEIVGQNVPLVIGVLANDTSAGGAMVPGSVTVDSPPAHGGAVANPATGFITYTPAAGYSGPDSLTYTACDAGGGCGTGTVSLRVNVQTVSTFAGAGPAPVAARPATTVAHRPSGLGIRGNDLYVSDHLNSDITKLDLITGMETRFAGDGSWSGWSPDGPALTTGQSQPTSTVFDAAGNLYTIQYQSFEIVRITPAGAVTTWASGIYGRELAIDAAGNLYVTETAYHRVWKIAAVTKVKTVIAGTGVAGFSGEGTAATAAKFNAPRAVAIGPDGALYIGDSGNNRIRKLNLGTGIVTTVAGTGVVADEAEGVPALTARISGPTTLYFSPAGELYLTDFLQKVRKISGGLLVTVAGTGSRGFSGDGGLAIDAQLASPHGPRFSASGDLYFADWLNSRVRKVDAATGVLTTVAGTGYDTQPVSGTAATDAPIVGPRMLSTDRAGNVYFAALMNSRAYKITPAGIITEVAGAHDNDGGGLGADGVPALGSALNGPLAVTPAANGDLYISDNRNGRIRKIDAQTGKITTPVSGVQPHDIFVAPDRTVYFSDDRSQVYKFRPPSDTPVLVAGTGVAGFSGDGGPATAAKLGGPRGLTMDSQGALYVAESTGYRVRKIATDGTISTVTGTGVGPASTYGVAAPLARTSNARGLAFDGAGTLFIVAIDRVLKVQGGVVNVVAGDGTTYGAFSGDGGPAIAAKFSALSDLVITSTGDLLISDHFNNRIRRITNAAVPPALPPVMSDDASAVARDGTVDVPVLANDVDDDAVVPGSVSIISAPAHGSATPNPTTGKVTYNPTPGYTGADGFDYLACNAGGGCASATVTIDVLDTPTGLAAEAGDESVELSWDDVPGADGYRLYRDTTLVYDGTDLDFTDSGLGNGATVTYAVAAVVGTGETPTSPAVSVTPTRGSTYRDEVRGDAPVAYWRLGESGGTVAADSSGHGRAAAVNVTALTAGVAGAIAGDADTAYATVDGASGTALTATTVPQIGDGLTAEFWLKAAPTLSQGSVVLDRLDPGVAGWRLQKAGAGASPLELRLDNSTGVNVAGATSGSNVFDDTWHHHVVVLAAGIARWYVDGELATTTAYSAGTGFGAAAPLTAEATGSLDEIALYDTALAAARVEAHYAAAIVPQEFSATAASPTSVELAWSPPGAGVTGYRVYRDGALLDTTTEPAYTDTVDGKSTHDYSVRAYRGGAESAPTEVVTVSTPLGAPTGLHVEAGEDSMTVSWDPLAAATGYELYRDGAQVYAGADTSYEDTPTLGGVAFDVTYTVLAADADGPSAPSAPVVATVPAAIPDPVVPVPPVDPPDDSDPDGSDPDGSDSDGTDPVVPRPEVQSPPIDPRIDVDPDARVTPDVSSGARSAPSDSPTEQSGDESGSNADYIVEGTATHDEAANDEAPPSIPMPGAISGNTAALAPASETPTSGPSVPYAVVGGLALLLMSLGGGAWIRRRSAVGAN